jgi:LPXTG-motif cell wall-anchored protein
MRYNMETVLIVLLVLFLLGGGGWGYRRWRN